MKKSRFTEEKIIEVLFSGAAACAETNATAKAAIKVMFGRARVMGTPNITRSRL